MIILWILLGLVFGSLLVFVANSQPVKARDEFLGKALVVAALIYVAFALVEASLTWFLIELVGLAYCSFFYVLGRRGRGVLIGLGWLAHPAWDVGLHHFGTGSSVAPEWYVFMCLSLT